MFTYEDLISEREEIFKHVVSINATYYGQSPPWLQWKVYHHVNQPHAITWLTKRLVFQNKILPYVNELPI
jgi:hypothetical protein